MTISKVGQKEARTQKRVVEFCLNALGIAAAETGFYIARTPMAMGGSIELLQYYRQQSVCANYHRHGNLGFRTGEFAEDG